MSKFFGGNGNGTVKGPDRGIIKSKAQMLRDAEMKIGELERKAEWLHNRVAYTLVAVNALGKHANLSAEEAKAVIDSYIKEQEVSISDQVKVAKEKFIEGMASGQPPQFKVIDNPDKPNG